MDHCKAVSIEATSCNGGSPPDSWQTERSQTTQVLDDGSMPVSEGDSTLQPTSFNAKNGDDAEIACRDVKSNISISTNMAGGVVYPASCTSSEHVQITAGYAEMAVDDSDSLGMNAQELEEVPTQPVTMPMVIEKPGKLTISNQRPGQLDITLASTTTNKADAERVNQPDSASGSTLLEFHEYADDGGSQTEHDESTFCLPLTNEIAYPEASTDGSSEGTAFHPAPTHTGEGERTDSPRHVMDDNDPSLESNPEGDGCPSDQYLPDQSVPFYYPAASVNDSLMGEMEQDEGPPKMIKILDIESDPTAVKVKLDSQAIDNVIKSQTCRDLSFLVISTNGKKRTGKSFTVNLMISFLEHLEKDTGETWLATDPEISGVEWRLGRTSVTTGIWMWNKPFVIKCGSNKVGVLLMDCQGLFDQLYNSDTVDAIITLCGLELSKVHLLNIQGHVNTSDLTHLQNCITFSGAGGTMDLFNTLILVHRDWNGDEEELGMRQNYFEYLRTTRDLNETEQNVANAFQECFEFMLPTPGRKILRGHVEQKVHLQDLLKESDSEEFLKYIEVLFQMLFVILGSDTKYLVDQNDLLNVVKKLNHRLADDKGVAQFESVAEVLEKKNILDAYEHFETNILPPYDSAISVERYSYVQQLEEEIAAMETIANELLTVQLQDIPCTTRAADIAKGMAKKNLTRWFDDMRARKLKAFDDKVQIEESNNVARGMAVAAVAGLIAGPIGFGLIAAEVTALGVSGASLGGVALGSAAAKVVGESVRSIKRWIKSRNESTQN